MLMLGRTALFAQVNTGKQEAEPLERAARLAQEGRSAEALTILESVLRIESRNARANYLLGRLAFSMKDYGRAAESLERAVELVGGQSDYHYWLSRAYGEQARNSGLFARAKLAPKVKAELERAVELDPANVEARFGLLRYLLRAPGFMGGSNQEARRQAEEIKKRNPLKGHAAFGVLYEAEKKWDLTEKEYLTARRESQGEPDPHYWLGSFYQARERYDDAFEVFETLVKSRPREIRAYYEIGRAGGLSGKRLGRAEECLKIYLEHQPDWDSPSLGSARYWLGRVYEHKGSGEQARREYELALKHEPHNEQAKEALKKLK